MSATPRRYQIEIDELKKTQEVMLAALKRTLAIVKAADLYDRLYDTMGYVEHAIAKAEGRQ